MRKICERCAYKDSDCKGNKEHGKGCKFYKKPNVFNAKEAAERIEWLEEENMKMAMQLKFLTNIYGISYQRMDVVIKASETMIKLFAASRTKEEAISLCEELERVIEEWKNSTTEKVT